jgi:hypothetical protein
VSHGSRESERRQGVRGRKGRKKGEWKRVDASHEVALYGIKTEEVVVLRKMYTCSVMATLNLPRFTVRDAPRGWLKGVLMAIIRRRGNGAGGEAATARVFTPWVTAHPLLWSYLTETSFHDGEPRATSTLSVMNGDMGGVKLVLNDRAEGLSLWATGADIPECLDTLELLLGEEEAPWKKDKRLALKPGKQK